MLLTTFSKGKVESGVGHAQKTPLKGKRFESLEEAQAYLDRWETHCADTRIHGTTKRQVAAMFAEEKPFLQSLPLEPFRYYQHGQRVVHLDGCVEVEAAYYGLPPGWIGRMVRVQWNEIFVRILDPQTGQLLREHLRQKRGWHRIQEKDLSPRRPWKVSQLLLRAERAGTQIGALCHHIDQYQGQLGVRRIQGVLSLVKKYGTAATEDACAAALEMGVREYRFVRRYLERTPQLVLRQVDPLILANSCIIAISSNKKPRSQNHECDRARSCSPPTSLRRHGCGSGNSPASGAIRTYASHRLPLLASSPTN